MPRSLRARLFLWLALPLSVCVAVCALLSWRHAAAVADYVQDHDLLSSAKVLSDRLIWEGDDIQASVPPSALSLFVSPAHDHVYLSVTDGQGRLLAGSPDFPQPPRLRLAGSDNAQWFDAHYAGQPIRAVVTQRTMYDVNGGAAVTIAVGKTTVSRDRMIATLWWPTVWYLLVALALALGLATLALTWELKPLVALSRRLAQDDPLRLDFAVDAGALHAELRPVADTINAFVQQQRAHAAAQRRFIADAAHQLRTPLALQATQIEFVRHARAHRGEWESRRADMDEMWRVMQASNRRLVDVTNKLLLLAQAEHSDASAALEPLDLRAAALAGVEQLAALADRRRIDLGVELPDAGPPTQVMAQPALLDALIANLLDNALRYTQEGGRVTLRVAVAPAHIELAVEDNGPGIEPALRERVFERFVRGAQDSEGTGLGLSIVREIVRAFGAQVRLDAPLDGSSGLRVGVRFVRAAPH